jgi:hypothetical protein
MSEKSYMQLPHVVLLSSNLYDHSALRPMEVTFAKIDAHGAVTLFRFVSGEQVERFELCLVELYALVGVKRKARSQAESYQVERLAELDNCPF